MPPVRHTITPKSPSKATRQPTPSTAKGSASAPSSKTVKQVGASSAKPPGGGKPV